MRLSARNQLAGTVDSVKQGDVLSSVKVTLGDGQTITAVVTRESVEELALASGDTVTVIIKSTEVMIGKN